MLLGVGLTRGVSACCLDITLFCLLGVGDTSGVSACCADITLLQGEYLLVVRIFCSACLTWCYKGYICSRVLVLA